MTQEQLFCAWAERQQINIGNLEYALKDEESTAWLMFQAFKAGRRMERELIREGKITIREFTDTLVACAECTPDGDPSGSNAREVLDKHGIPWGDVPIDGGAES